MFLSFYLSTENNTYIVIEFIALFVRVCLISFESVFVLARTFVRDFKNVFNSFTSPTICMQVISFVERKTRTLYPPYPQKTGNTIFA